jgi:hypothetical protein
MRARVFLRQPLFTFPGSHGHVPANAVVLDGVCTPVEGIGLKVEVSDYFDEKGRKLEGKSTVLLVSAAKLDHLLILD